MASQPYQWNIRKKTLGLAEPLRRAPILEAIVARRPTKYEAFGKELLARMKEQNVNSATLGEYLHEQMGCSSATAANIITNLKQGNYLATTTQNPKDPQICADRAAYVCYALGVPEDHEMMPTLREHFELWGAKLNYPPADGKRLEELAARYWG